jgi:hypothetical protein
MLADGKIVDPDGLRVRRVEEVTHGLKEIRDAFLFPDVADLW